MLSTLRQARAALSHLNPQQVRDLANRTLRVGLIAATESGYAAMEETLIPASAPPNGATAGKKLLFRGDDPVAPPSVDLVLYGEGLRAPKEAYTLDPNDPAATLDAILKDHPEYELPLARQFPGLRREVVDRIIQGIARENAMFSVATALPDVIPSFVEMPWAFGEWASDTAFLTANQVRMAFLISAACGQEIGFGQQKAQLLSIGAGAFGWRAIARELAGKIPLGGGLIAKGAIAFAATVLVGKGLEYLHREQVDFPSELRKRTYKDALERGREVTQSWLRKLPAVSSRRSQAASD
jgi:hypothetical protein